MADNETRAVIVLSAGEPIKVKETVEEILRALEAVTSLHIPVIKVTDDRGTELRINANQILKFHEPIERESAGS